MVYGKTYREQLEPRLIFAYLPRRLRDGRKVWWQHVWKGIDSQYDPVYCLTKEEAQKYYPSHLKRTVVGF